MKKLIEEIEADVVKAENGNNAAGTRVRKQMQEIKKTAQEIRANILKLRA